MTNETEYTLASTIIDLKLVMASPIIELRKDDVAVKIDVKDGELTVDVEGGTVSEAASTFFEWLKTIAFNGVSALEIKGLKDAAQPSQGVLEWQPIETAPKDGGPVMLFGTRFGWKAAPSRVCGFWNGNSWWIYGASDGEPRKGRKSTQTLDTIDATHWTPLPKPPANKER